MRRSVHTTLLVAACFALPTASASAQQTVVAADPAAQQVTALDGTIVWVSGEFGSQRLVQRAPDGTISAVEGAPLSRSYRSLDLGRDSDGKLLLTYLRCDAARACKSLWNDLDGRRATFRNLEPPKCRSSAVSRWRTRLAYGLSCSGWQSNRRRTGLYVKNGPRRALRLALPKDAARFGVRFIESVDLRGERVAAVAADVYEYSFSQTVGGRGMRSFLAAASEGESEASARGLAIQSASTHWTLTVSEHTGDPNEAILLRQRGDCVQRERLISPAGAPQQAFEAIDVAADGATLYLVRPGIGIVTHTFTPDPALPCR